jgi:hypothetical protein
MPLRCQRPSRWGRTAPQAYVPRAETDEI